MSVSPATKTRRQIRSVPSLPELTPLAASSHARPVWPRDRLPSILAVADVELPAHNYLTVLFALFKYRLQYLLAPAFGNVTSIFEVLERESQSAPWQTPLVCELQSC